MMRPHKGLGVRTVAKIRRTRESAYGSREAWQHLSEQVKIRDGYRCRKCGRTKATGARWLEADHIVPVSRGGRTVLFNLWCLCDLCHSKRPFHNHLRR